ncbi:probable secreted protein [Streptomyces himastatinicus ATCC 53653]|uniref:Probable secreted protein n=1 Tax=Streptomyces himastatinicus ATCC 53653 TaxID=457427 RepID=D9WVN6_9ACTN|nr:probable secreted protein [Streptomyces himastatinicus ATCC 53653]
MTTAEQHPGASVSGTNGSPTSDRPGGSGAPGAPGSSGGSGGSGGDGGRPPRRWLKAVIVFLLITIPAGYLAISAMQSRDGGSEKVQSAKAKGLSAGYPSRVQRRIYDIPVPQNSLKVASFETNSWKVSSLYVQFVTSRDGLDRFLAKLGTGPSALKKGAVTITDEQAKKVGWQVGAAGHDWSGMVIKQKEPQPKLRITVRNDNPAHPKVYVVSTIRP